MVDRRRSNRLAEETSPYLIQHSHNPVDWYPWGEDALTRAKAEDKPMLLSIGYSACHWCHVMAHESFENDETASLMNASFINIKVDREERPDLDAVYMDAVQAMTGNGGWPLTVFLTPHGRPFYGGTYFPPEDRYGMPGFPRVLRAVADFYRTRRGELEEVAGQITSTLQAQVSPVADARPLETGVLSEAFSALKRDFDALNGGFGTAPKFPQPLILEFLLRYHHRTDDEDALHMTTATMEKMARAGIYDQIGGGFHRYATDSKWLVPHFEKMLYDNALLSRAYLHAHVVTGTQLFRCIAEQTIDYVLREMTGPEGGFYSSQDADSEGAEGRYYLWTPGEIRQILGEKTARIVIEHFGVTDQGNFEGRSILHMPNQASQPDPDTIRQAKGSLLRAREQRVRPGRDDKVLASWNGLMLASLAEAACVLNRDDYLVAAEANGLFLLRSMMSDGYLKHTCKEGQSGVEGFLEDYALVIQSFIGLHLATFSGDWLRQAIRLAHVMIESFWDESTGVFYDTGRRHEHLLIRPSSTGDGAMPSGSSAATSALTTISRLTGDRRLENIAGRSLQAMQDRMARHPLGFGNWLSALDLFLSAPKEIVIVGSPNDTATADLLRILCNTWLPTSIVVAVDPGDRSPVEDLALLQNRPMLDDKPTVYICERHTCQTPIGDPDLLRERLHSNQ